MTNEKLDRLCQAIKDTSSVLILPHNDPDPDAIASAVTLKYLLEERARVEVQIAYKGIIGRAENKALVHYLDHPLQRLTGSHLRKEGLIALVDTQPGAGNNALPPGVGAAVVLDHHPLREATTAARFADVRPDVGSTSTILTEYLQVANIEPPTQLATALFYGIKTDTMGLVRGASPADVAAYLYLQPRIDVDGLVEVERAGVPADYFRALDTAIQAARVYKDTVVSYVGAMNRPDLAAEMADLLSRLRAVRWVICMGVYKNDLILAVRTRTRRGGAGHLAQAIAANRGTAGGHGNMAGGNIPLQGEDPVELAQKITQRLLELLEISSKTVGKPLL